MGVSGFFCFAISVTGALHSYGKSGSIMVFFFFNQVLWPPALSLSPQSRAFLTVSHLNPSWKAEGS